MTRTRKSVAAAALVALAGGILAPVPSAYSHEIKAAITQQVNQVNAKNSKKVDSHIELVTLIKQPFVIDVMTVATPPKIKFLGATTTKTADVCLSKKPTGQKCKQRHMINLDANKACKLNGKYLVKVTVMCAKGVKSKDCKGYPKEDRIELKLESENFCQTTGVSN